MAKKINTHTGSSNKTTDDKALLYAEVGKFFSLKGEFDETKFRKSLRNSLLAIKQRHTKKETLNETISQWLTHTFQT